VSAGDTDPGTTALPFNSALAGRLQRVEGVDLAGSIYAVPAPDRTEAARLLAGRRAWVHADVFADARDGVGLDLIAALADGGVGPVDVHLLTADALAPLDVVCRPGIARITFPYEDVEDVGAVAGRIRASGVQPWLALSPGTTLARCADALDHVDGLLVMLLEPGDRGASDLALLAKVTEARGRLPVGVDGGIGEADVSRVLAAGASYVVVGRQLFPATGSRRDPSAPHRPAHDRSDDER
jgi:pentose-5-phosphate-3-epimerase